MKLPSTNQLGTSGTKTPSLPQTLIVATIALIMSSILVAQDVI